VRFAFTLEECRTLIEAERARMPDADTVWLTPLEQMRELLARAGLAVTWQEECTRSHREMAAALLEAYAADGPAIAAAVGRRARDDLLTAHRLWIEWLATGRARKFALVAQSGSDPEQRP
jgi:hypothetical protein